MQIYLSVSKLVGCVDIGVKLAIIALGIKKRFYANGFFRPKGKILRRTSRSVQNGNILRGVVWRKSALVILCKVDIKGRFYANLISVSNCRGSPTVKAALCAVKHL